MSARYVTIGAMVAVGAGTVVGIVVVIVVVDGWVRPASLAASRDGCTSVVAVGVSVGTVDVPATDVASGDDVLAAPIIAMP
jgi:hypothetical protein